MKKSRKKLAIAANLAGAVAASLQACQNNVAVYGPPPMDQDAANEASSGAATNGDHEISEEPNEYDPDENMMPDVYGPPIED